MVTVMMRMMLYICACLFACLLARRLGARLFAALYHIQSSLLFLAAFNCRNRLFRLKKRRSASWEAERPCVALIFFFIVIVSCIPFFFAGGRSSPAAPAVLIAFFQSRGGGPAFGKAVLMEDDLRGEPSAPNEAGGAKSGYGQTGQG